MPIIKIKLHREGYALLFNYKSILTYLLPGCKKSHGYASD